MNASRLPLPVVVLLFAVSGACADPITFSYGISGSANSNSEPANGTTFTIGTGGGVAAGTSRPVTITDGAYPWSIEIFPNPTWTPTFTNVPIAVTVSLTDSAAKAVAGAVPSGALLFNGLLSGQWNHAEDAWRLTSYPSTESITLGSPGQFHTYTVGAPYLWSPSFGTVDAAAPVEVSDYRPGIDPAPGAVSSAPEPSSILLAAMGLPVLIAGRRVWRGRKTPGIDGAPTLP
jgi:hypothetical protein